VSSQTALRVNDPLGFEFLNDTQFGPEEEDITVQWDTVHRIYTDAQKCHGDGKDENEWIEVIRKSSELLIR